MEYEGKWNGWGCLEVRMRASFIMKILEAEHPRE